MWEFLIGDNNGGQDRGSVGEEDRGSDSSTTSRRSHLILFARNGESMVWTKIERRGNMLRRKTVRRCQHTYPVGKFVHTNV